MSFHNGLSSGQLAGQRAYASTAVASKIISFRTPVADDSTDAAVTHQYFAMIPRGTRIHQAAIYGAVSTASTLDLKFVPVGGRESDEETLLSLDSGTTFNVAGPLVVEFDVDGMLFLEFGTRYHRDGTTNGVSVVVHVSSPAGPPLEDS